MGKRQESFGVALAAVRGALEQSQTQFGARFGVSRRTLTRWEAHDELPPEPMRKHIATSIPDAPAELREALVRSMGLGGAFLALAAPAPAATAPAAVASVDPAALDGAYLDLCERAEVPPGRLRRPLVEFLRRAEASGLSLAATRTVLELRNAGDARTSKR